MKILRKILKIITLIIASILILLVLLVGLAKLFESELVSFTLGRLEKRIDAPLSIGKVSLIPLFSFPRVSAEINDLLIGNPNGYNDDTLFCIGSLKVGLDSWNFFHGIYTIDKIEISDVSFDYEVLENGESNIDFLIQAFSDTTTVINTKPEQASDLLATPLDITAEKIKLENIQINYMDSINTIGAQLNIPEIHIEGKAKDNIYKGKLEGRFILSHCLYKETNLNRMESCEIDFELAYDNDIATISKLLVSSEGIKLNMEGAFNLADTLNIAADLKANDLDLAILKKYIPERYLDKYGIIEISGLTDISAGINGSYADSTLLPLIQADVTLKNIQLSTKSFPEITSLNLSSSISNGDKTDLSDARVNISNLHIASPVGLLQLKGAFSNLKKPKYNFTSKLDLNLEEFENYIPDSLVRNLKGKALVSISTSGLLPDTLTIEFADYFLDKSLVSLTFDSVSVLYSDSLQVDHFSAEISCIPQDSGKRKIQVSHLNLKSDSLKLNLTNSSLTALLSGRVSEPYKMGSDVQSFSLQNGNNLATGSFKIKNFEAPEYDLKTNLLISLSELSSFIPDSLVKSMKGSIQANIQSKGMIHPDSLETQLLPLIFDKSSFNIELNNVSLEFPDSIMNVDRVFSSFSLRNDTLNIDKLSVNYNGLDIILDSIVIKNLYKAVLLNQQEELYVKTNLKLGDILYKDFQHLLAMRGLSDPAADSTKLSTDINVDSSQTDFKQNWTYLIHGKASISSILIDSTAIEGYRINQLHILDLSTAFKITDSSFIADQFMFKAFEGTMTNSFYYKKRADGSQSLSSHNIIQGMNIRKLLKDMDNFGMDSIITYENISGLFSIDINTFIPISDSIDTKKIRVSGDLSIEQGGVYDYKPAQQLSKFSGIKELDNIKFKSLHSKIFMFNNNLYVPRTQIVSNATDIAAFGMQSLGDDYEYHLEVHLSNILFGKSKKRNNKQNESGSEINEGDVKKSSHKLIYSEVDGKSKVGWDTKDAREKMMNKIRTQNKMLDFIFYPKNIHYNTDVDKNH